MMEGNKGKSNAHSLFGVYQISSDNQIRDLLEPVTPEHGFPGFEEILQVLEQQGQLESFRSVVDNLLIAIDGTEYFSSSQIHCSNCSTRTLKSEETHYFHSVITPIIVCPGEAHVIPLVPQFIVPQDEPDKQDCENAAAKRWLAQQGPRLSSLNVTVLGDDLYCRQPLCQQLHPGVTVTYKNSFATNHMLSDENVVEIVLAGRARWKVENENNNMLKTKGYNLEHNFGHGKQHLSSLLATLNILFLLFHTLLELLDQKYKLLRSHLPTRKTFFDDLRTLTRYMYFDSWKHLLTFMMEGLELDIPPNTS